MSNFELYCVFFRLHNKTVGTKTTSFHEPSNEHKLTHNQPLMRVSIDDFIQNKNLTENDYIFCSYK